MHLSTFSVVLFIVSHLHILEGMSIYRQIRSIGGRKHPSLFDSSSNLENVLPDSELIQVNGKKQVRKTEDEILVAIENLAKEIPIDRFLEDPILVQTIDRINSVTEYSIPLDDEDDQNQEALFQRQQSDNLKEVVVLRSTEDKLAHGDKEHKNIYVILRRLPNPTNTKPVHYFLFYAYLRPAKSNDSEIILDSSGVKQTIEWDNWDDGEIQKDTQTGWTSCSSTVFFSCNTNENTNKINLGTNAEQNSPANISNAKRDETISVFKVGKDGYDPNEYYRLFEDFDELSPKEMEGRAVGGGGASARGIPGGNIICGAFSMFSKPKCGDKKGASSKKGTSLPTDIASDVTSGITSFKPSTENLLPSNLMPTYGSFYSGRNMNPGIFIPANKGMPSIFVPDVDDSVTPRLIHGELFAPTAPSAPLTFIPKENYMLRGIYNYRGTFVPDGLTELGYIGGVHGSLSERSSNGIFTTDVSPKNYYLDPKLADPKVVFVNPQLMNGAAEVTTTAQPVKQKTISGIIFEGVIGALRIFIPDGDGLAGYFLPSDPIHPAFGNAPHGEIYPHKSGIATFFPDIKGTVSNYRDVLGAFGPDALDGVGFIFGKMTDSGKNGVLFTPNHLGRLYVYVLDSPDVEDVWAPFAPKGVATTTVRPLIRKSKNPEHYGIYFQGLPPIFFPKGRPIKGRISDDRSGSISLHGTFYPGTPGSAPIFEPDPKDVSVAHKYSNFKSKFLPDQLVSNSKGRGGIGGTFVSDTNNIRNVTFYPDVDSVPWYYDPDHPDEGVWSPSFAAEPALATEADSSGIPQAEMNRLKNRTPTLIRGIYFKGTSATSGVFIPDEIKVQGIIIPDSNVYPQLHGIFNPGHPGDKSEFTLDSPTALAAGLSFAGKFFPDGIRHPSQGVKGILTMNEATEMDFIFRPDTPSKSYLFNPNNSMENALLWAPRIPGVTVMDETNETTSRSEKAERESATNTSSDSEGVFGVLYPPVGGSKGTLIISRYWNNHGYEAEMKEGGHSHSKKLQSQVGGKLGNRKFEWEMKHKSSVSINSVSLSLALFLVAL